MFILVFCLPVIEWLGLLLSLLLLLFFCLFFAGQSYIRLSEKNFSILLLLWWSCSSESTKLQVQYAVWMAGLVSLLFSFPLSLWAGRHSVPLSGCTFVCPKVVLHFSLTACWTPLWNFPWVMSNKPAVSYQLVTALDFALKKQTTDFVGEDMSFFLPKTLVFFFM